MAVERDRGGTRQGQCGDQARGQHQTGEDAP